MMISITRESYVFNQICKLLENKYIIGVGFHKEYKVTFLLLKIDSETYAVRSINANSLMASICELRDIHFNEMKNFKPMKKDDFITLDKILENEAYKNLLKEVFEKERRFETKIKYNEGETNEV